MKRMGWDDQMSDLKQLTKFKVHVLPEDRLRRWDDQIRDLKTINPVHVLSGNG